MFQPQHQGQEHPGIAKLDELLQAPLLTASIMSRAGQTDKARYRAKFREQLQDAVNFGMKLVDEFSK